MNCLHQIREVSLDDIVVEIERHPRKEIYEETIQEYAEALSKGFMLPEIEVFFDGETYHLAEGYYRVEAHRRAELDLIYAIVHQGGRKEALIHALGANADHGLRRTNADKRKAVEIALKDPDIQMWSDRKIAYTIRVSQPFVSEIRKKLTDSGYKSKKKRECSNGRIIDVSNIGRKKKVASAPTEPELPEVGGNTINLPVEENPESLENQSQDSNENVDENNDDRVLGQEAQETVVIPTEIELEENVQDLTLEDDVVTDLPAQENPETVENQDQEPEQDVDENNEDNDPGEENQGVGGSSTETEPAQNGQNLNLVESGEGTGDNDQENIELNEVTPDALELQVIHLQEIIKKQETEIEAKNSCIADLGQQVEKLKDDNEYLRKELDASIKVGTGASAFLDTHSMDNNHVSLRA